MVSDRSMDDLLEMYYGKDRTNWPEIRVRVSNVEVSWDVFNQLPMDNKKAQVNYLEDGSFDGLQKLYGRD